MSIWESITGGVVKELGDAIDKNITSDEERLKLKKDIKKIEESSKQKEREYLNKRLELETKRMNIDKEHVITRLVRPIALLMTTLFFGFIMLADGNFENFTIREEYISIIQTVWISMVGFYFTSRGLEKISRRRDPK